MANLRGQVFVEISFHPLCMYLSVDLLGHLEPCVALFEEWPGCPPWWLPVLHAPQLRGTAPVCLRLCRHLVLSVFLTIAILLGVKSLRFVFLICVSLMAPCSVLSRAPHLLFG